ncbi:dienelactone hydrolase family protein [Rhodovulum sp. 12E13]|uniref:dienelactone hydrolase family protein n=1 Tax=Rhodovulum sp. 12E13 TaxID=2203891 RepID=UPI000E19113D|nr:dienelactone hydrolase family protein [Rhodovulum sp. 12E13]RDC71681.1 dienelactone hydrolase family protein [Rhodovulum sp. 12E13]
MTRTPLTATLAIVAAGTLVTPAAAELVMQDFDYEVGGVPMQGHVARNTAVEPRGTVLIVHDWDGLTDYEETRAGMLAALGYTAVAIDVYGRDNRPTSMEENRARSGELYADRELFRQRLTGALEAARGLDGVDDDIALIGYCFGGAAVLEAARAGMDVDAFVSFHGGLPTPEGQSYEGASGPVMFFHGSADPVSGPGDLAQVMAEMLEAGVEHQAHIYGGARHSFTVWGSNDYDLEADTASWSALQAFLAEEL